MVAGPQQVTELSLSSAHACVLQSFTERAPVPGGRGAQVEDSKVAAVVYPRRLLASPEPQHRTPPFVNTAHIALLEAEKSTVQVLPPKTSPVHPTTAVLFSHHLLATPFPTH